MSLCKMQCAARGSKGYSQTIYIATAQTIEAVVMVLIFFCGTFRNKYEADPDFNQDEEDALDKKFIVLLIYGVVQLALAILLYIGNEKESIGLLRTWVAIETIANILGIIGIIILAVYSDQSPRVAFFLIVGFVTFILISIVENQRIPEIYMTSGALDHVERPVTQDRHV